MRFRADARFRAWYWGMNVRRRCTGCCVPCWCCAESARESVLLRYGFSLRQGEAPWPLQSGRQPAFRCLTVQILPRRTTDEQGWFLQPENPFRPQRCPFGLWSRPSSRLLLLPSDLFRLFSFLLLWEACCTHRFVRTGQWHL